MSGSTLDVTSSSTCHGANVSQLSFAKQFLGSTRTELPTRQARQIQCPRHSLTLIAQLPPLRSPVCRCCSINSQLAQLSTGSQLQSRSHCRRRDLRGTIQVTCSHPDIENAGV